LEKLIFGNEMSQRASAGSATVEDIWDHVQDQLGLADEEMKGFKRDFFKGDEIDEELIDFIRSFKHSMKTGMITNAWPGMRHFIEGEWAIADAFDAIVVSAEVQLVKPDPRIYHLALNQLGVSAGEAVFIDDFIENVQGAEDIGMVGIHFRSRDEVISKLSSMIDLKT
jgi:putative hydrolase of the HAD superfamily